MDTTEENGISQRESLHHVLEASPQNSGAYITAEEKLNAEPQIPACLEHVYNWFWKLHRKRGQGFNGPNPLTYQEIKSWRELTRTEIYPFEVELIQDLDTAYMNYVADKQKTKQQQNKHKKK